MMTGSEPKKNYGSLDTSDQEPSERKVPRWMALHTFAVMGFLGQANVYALRVNLNVAIVAMVNTTISLNSSDYGQECPAREGAGAQNEPNANAVFNWDAEQQGIILGAFYYGFFVTQIPGGALAEKFGGKWVYGMGVLVPAILNLLTPSAAYAGTIPFIILKVVQGLGEGVTLPAVSAMLTKWVPPEMRSKYTSFVFAGSQAGTLISLPVSGWLADTFSWEYIFYVFGTLGCVWFIIWALIVFSSPEDHPRISKNETSYILERRPAHNEGKSLPFPPLHQILTSVPVWTLVFTHFAYNWGFYILLTDTPTYLSNIQHFSLSANGVLGALPYLFKVLLGVGSGVLADYLIAKRYISAHASRKIFNSLGMFVPAMAFIWLAFVGCDSAMAVAALCLATGFCGMTFSGFQLGAMDLSPNYAGTLFGLSSTFASIGGIFVPYFVGSITNGNQTIAAWRTVFLTGAVLNVMFNVVFLKFGRTEIQSWNTYWLD